MLACFRFVVCAVVLCLPLISHATAYCNTEYDDPVYPSCSGAGACSNATAMCHCDAMRFEHDGTPSSSSFDPTCALSLRSASPSLYDGAYIVISVSMCVIAAGIFLTFLRLSFRAPGPDSRFERIVVTSSNLLKPTRGMLKFARWVTALMTMVMVWIVADVLYDPFGAGAKLNAITMPSVLPSKTVSKGSFEFRLRDTLEDLVELLLLGGYILVWIAGYRKACVPAPAILSGDRFMSSWCGGSGEDEEAAETGKKNAKDGKQKHQRAKSSIDTVYAWTNEEDLEAEEEREEAAAEERLRRLVEQAGRTKGTNAQHAAAIAAATAEAAAARETRLRNDQIRARHKMHMMLLEAQAADASASQLAQSAYGQAMQKHRINKFTEELKEGQRKRKEAAAAAAAAAAATGSPAKAPPASQAPPPPPPAPPRIPAPSASKYAVSSDAEADNADLQGGGQTQDLKPFTIRLNSTQVVVAASPAAGSTSSSEEPAAPPAAATTTSASGALTSVVLHPPMSADEASRIAEESAGVSDSDLRSFPTPDYFKLTYFSLILIPVALFVVLIVADIAMAANISNDVGQSGNAPRAVFIVALLIGYLILHTWFLFYILAFWHPLYLISLKEELLLAAGVPLPKHRMIVGSPGSTDTSGAIEVVREEDTDPDKRVQLQAVKSVDMFQQQEQEAQEEEEMRKKKEKKQAKKKTKDEPAAPVVLTESTSTLNFGLKTAWELNSLHELWRLYMSVLLFLTLAHNVIILLGSLIFPISGSRKGETGLSADWLVIYVFINRVFQALRATGMVMCVYPFQPLIQLTTLANFWLDGKLSLGYKPAHKRYRGMLDHKGEKTEQKSHKSNKILPDPDAAPQLPENPDAEANPAAMSGFVPPPLNRLDSALVELQKIKTFHAPSRPVATLQKTDSQLELTDSVLGGVPSSISSLSTASMAWFPLFMTTTFLPIPTHKDLQELEKAQEEAAGGAAAAAGEGLMRDLKRMKKFDRLSGGGGVSRLWKPGKRWERMFGSSPTFVEREEFLAQAEKDQRLDRAIAHTQVEVWKRQQIAYFAAKEREKERKAKLEKEKIERKQNKYMREFAKARGLVWKPAGSKADEEEKKQSHDDDGAASVTAPAAPTDAEISASVSSPSAIAAPSRTRIIPAGDEKEALSGIRIVAAEQKDALSGVRFSAAEEKADNDLFSPLTTSAVLRGEAVILHAAGAEREYARQQRTEDKQKKAQEIRQEMKRLQAKIDANASPAKRLPPLPTAATAPTGTGIKRKVPLKLPAVSVPHPPSVSLDEERKEASPLPGVLPQAALDEQQLLNEEDDFAPESESSRSEQRNEC
jgi:hypothetical protein